MKRQELLRKYATFMNQYADVYMNNNNINTNNNNNAYTSSNSSSNIEKQKNLERDLKNLFTNSSHNSDPSPPSS